MQTPLIAVTGVTGFVGARVAELLAASGARLRVLARDPGRISLLGDFEAAAVAYRDPVAARTALQGVDLLFMVSAGESIDRLAEHRTFVEAAGAAGVRHVVYTSFQGAAPQATFTLARDHWGTEQAVRDSGMSWTFLRDSFYLDFLPLVVGQDGVIRGPAGQGRVAAVARADVARSAAAILGEADRHVGAVYDLTGPQALTLAEVAAVVAEATGRSVSYHDETVAEAYASRAPYGAPDWQVDAWVSTYLAIANGEMSPLSDAVERLTGTPPLSLKEFLALPQ